MKRLYLLYLCTILAGTFGCQNIDGVESLNTEPNAESRRIIVLGIDETGSYKLWEQVKTVAFGIIDQLGPGDIFYCRRIVEASYLDDCTIFRVEIPLLKRIDTENPFDRKAKSLHRAQVFQVGLMKKEARDRLSAVRFSNAQHTDIYGFLAAASDRYRLVPKEFQRFLIIASDLKDNVGYKASFDLTGVRLGVIGFQSSDDPGSTRALKKSWKKIFSDAGASNVIFLSIEEPFTLDGF